MAKPVFTSSTPGGVSQGNSLPLRNQAPGFSQPSRYTSKFYNIGYHKINPGLPSVLKLVVILLLVIMASTVLSNVVEEIAINTQKFTFYRFISMLQEVPSIDFKWVTNLNAVLDFQFPDWLSWLSVFWEPIRGMLTVGGFVANSLLNVAIFVYYILTYFIMP